jgi:iron complex transport system substrate-binding protein
VEREKNVVFTYEGVRFDNGLRVDLLVNGSVVVELKSVETLAPVHYKQVLTYLRLMDLRVGLLVNFGAPLLKQGIKRIVN